MRVALLDDYQGVALDYLALVDADPRVHYDAFDDHLDDLDALVARLEPDRKSTRLNSSH